jgi:hypothetical protein
MVNSGFRMEQATDPADHDPFEPEGLLEEVGVVSCLGYSHAAKIAVRRSKLQAAVSGAAALSL